MKALTRFSPIVPLPILEDLLSTDELGNYVLLLAHDVIDHTERYKDIARALRDSDAPERVNSFIILDNSAVEMGNPIMPSALREVAHELCVDCYVLPDILGDYTDTLALCEGCATETETIGIPTMKVPQGNSHEELIKCAQILHSSMPIIKHSTRGNLWAVPRWITNKLGSRKPMIQFLNAMIPEGLSIHLLGFSTNYVDDMECTALPNVIGIDSANPATLGQQGLRYCMYQKKDIPHKDRGTLWEHIKVTPSTRANIKFVRDDILQANR